MGLPDIYKETRHEKSPLQFRAKGFCMILRFALYLQHTHSSAANAAGWLEGKNQAERHHY